MAYKDRTPEQNREQQRRRRSRNPEYQREYRRRNREKFAHYKRKAAYGLTPEATTAMWDEQQGLCAACGTVLSRERTFLWCIDHNHVTGAVRGIVCRKCNAALGILETSDISGLQAYLREKG